MEFLLLRRRRSASLVSFVPSDEDIAAAPRRSKALAALPEYHKSQVAAATLVSRAELHLRPQKCDCTGYSLEDICRTNTTPNERPMLEKVDGRNDIYWLEADFRYADIRTVGGT